MDLLEKQPGAEFATGTWWQPANSVTYMFDHLIGHNADNRLTNSWYGSGRKTKIDAMKLAVEMAQNSIINKQKTWYRNIPRFFKFLTLEYVLLLL